MTVILIEGFDYESNTSHDQNVAHDNNLYESGWSVTSFNQYGNPRTSLGPAGRCASASFNNGLDKDLGASYTSLIIGWGTNFDHWSMQIYGWKDAGGGQAAKLYLDGSGHLYLADKNNTTIVTGTTVLSTNTWYYIELKITTAGAYELRLFGQPTAEFSGTGQNFSTSLRTVDFAAGTLGAAQKVDDVYVLDTTTGTNTDFLGDCVVITEPPSSDGTHTDFIPKTGSTHYTQVSEGYMDWDTTFVQGGILGWMDTYNITDISSYQVYALQVQIEVRQETASPVNQIATVIRQSGTDYVGTTQNVPGGTTYYAVTQIYEQDPTSTNWTYTQANADEFGLKLVA